MDFEGMVVWNFVALEVFESAFVSCRRFFLFDFCLYVILMQNHMI